MQRIVITRKVGGAFVVDGSATVRIMQIDSQEVKLLIEASPQTKIRRESRIKPPHNA